MNATTPFRDPKWVREEIEAEAADKFIDDEIAAGTAQGKTAEEVLEDLCGWDSAVSNAALDRACDRLWWINGV